MPKIFTVASLLFKTMIKILTIKNLHKNILKKKKKQWNARDKNTYVSK